jgi:hypothetical protein
MFARGRWAARGNAGPLPKSSVLEQASALFARSAWASTSYAALPLLTRREPAKYWEANLIGNPHYPTAVRFLLPLFGALFGTSNGHLVRALADQHRWPLVWALGDATDGAGGGTNSTPTAANGRILDPVVIGAARLNATFSADAVQTFDKVWREAVEARQAAGGTPPASVVRAWWAQLRPKTARLAPVTAIACADADGCVGVDVATGSCVCIV